MTALLLALALEAATLDVRPVTARPGDALLLEARGVDAPPSGRLGGRPLLFWPAAGAFRAIAALPLETVPGAVAIDADAVEGGAQVRLEARVDVVPPEFPSRELKVERRFIEPSPAEKARMEADHAAIAAARSQPFSGPLFTASFIRPREARATGRFGDRRLFNGRLDNQHYGLDLEGKVGAPVRAANDGRVVLVRDCYASGRTVILHHGANLYTLYFHLSRVLARPGELVHRGQRIGRVGKSGRVTGPHLHWSVMVGDLYVDPESLLRIRF